MVFLLLFLGLFWRQLVRIARATAVDLQRFGLKPWSLLPSSLLSLAAVLTVNAPIFHLILLCSALHLVWFLILHLLQAIVVRRTYPIRPPPKPDPVSWFKHIVGAVVIAQWTSLFEVILFGTALRLVDLVISQFMHSPTLRPTHYGRPPPKPDPPSSFAEWFVTKFVPA